MLLALVMSYSGLAQDDDVYFVPSKSAKAETRAKVASRSSYGATGETEVYSYDNWAEGRDNRSMDVDAYNRRGGNADSVSAFSAEENAAGTYTSRIVRFHSPSIGVYVSSPYYIDVYDYWYDPWFSPFYYHSWFYPSWYYGWYGGWYGWGMGPYWHSWHHYPWYDYAWGWGGRYHPVWNGSVRPRDTGRRVTNYRPSRGYASNNRGGVNRPSRNYDYSRPSRGSGTTGRPSRSFGNSSSSSRDYGNGSVGTSSRPTRNYNNSSRSTGSGTSTRSYSAPSRSSGSSGTISSPSRNYGSGGSRSYGGGGSRGRR